MRLLPLVMLASCVSVTQLASESDYHGVCKASRNDPLTGDEQRVIGQSLAQHVGLSVQGRVLDADATAELLGFPYEGTGRFVELRWRIARAPAHAQVQANAYVDDDGLRHFQLPRSFGNDDLPMPSAWTDEPIPPAYEPAEFTGRTPRPELDYVYTRPSRAQRAVGGVLRFVSAGRLRTPTGGRRLTRASQRTLDRWEAENAPYRAEHDAEQARLTAEREAERDAARQRNEVRAERRASFEQLKYEVIQRLDERRCLTISSEACVEVRYLPRERLSMEPVRAKVSLSLSYVSGYSESCPQRLYYQTPVRALDDALRFEDLEVTGFESGF